MSIDSLTRRMTEKQEHPEFRMALLMGMPAKLLGKQIAEHIDQIYVEDDCLYLAIRNDAWRKELTSRRPLLLGEAKKILDHIRDVRFTS